MENPLRRTATSDASAAEDATASARNETTLSQIFTGPTSTYSSQIDAYERSLAYPPTRDLPTTCSIAAATPLWSLGKVTAQPLRRNSSDAFPMINGSPAKASIFVSF